MKDASSATRDRQSEMDIQGYICERVVASDSTRRKHKGSLPVQKVVMRAASMASQLVARWADYSVAWKDDLMVVLKAGM